MTAREAERPLCVVLDTNQWDAHRMLRSHLAASLIFLIERHKAKLGVPEVVAAEVGSHAVEAYRKAIGEASSTMDRIRMILGRSPDPDFLPEEAARDALQERLEELGDLVVRLDIEDRHHIAAGAMVLAGTAPNAERSQQFKDCLLWQAVLDLTADYDVVLVTADGGFYSDAKTDALHPDLAGNTGNGVRLVRSMQGAVALLQEHAPVLDLDSVLSAIDGALRPQVDGMGQARGFVTEGVNNAFAEAFVTGQPGETLVVFEMTHDLVGPSDGLARVITEGEAVIKGGTVTSLRLDSMEMEVYGDRGFDPAGRTLFVRASDTIGARHRQHELRVRAPGSQPGWR